MSNFIKFYEADSRSAEAAIRSSFVVNEETDLLQSALAGDNAAFENLVMPHKDSILRIAQRILRNREDAEDAMQAAFLHALRHLHSFQGRSRFSSWLTRIAINAAFMQLRAVRRNRETSIDEMAASDKSSKPLDLVEARPNPEQECAAKEIRALCSNSFDRLPPHHAEILYMRIAEELSVDEAAHALNMPAGTVKARLHRARTALTKRVQSRITPRRIPAVT